MKSLKEQIYFRKEAVVYYGIICLTLEKYMQMVQTGKSSGVTFL